MRLREWASNAAMRAFSIFVTTCASTPKFPQLKDSQNPAGAGISWRGCPRAAPLGWD